LTGTPNQHRDSRTLEACPHDDETCSPPIINLFGQEAVIAGRSEGD